MLFTEKSFFLEYLKINFNAIGLVGIYIFTIITCYIYAVILKKIIKNKNIKTHNKDDGNV